MTYRVADHYRPIIKRRNREAVRGPADVNRLLSDLKNQDRETFIAMYLDVRHTVLATSVVSVGSKDASLVHPREVFSAAIAHGANALVVAHNHPSGDPTPSSDDIALTSRLHRCGQLLGIQLLDHVVCAEGGWSSIRETNPDAFNHVSI